MQALANLHGSRLLVQWPGEFGRSAHRTRDLCHPKEIENREQAQKKRGTEVPRICFMC